MATAADPSNLGQFSSLLSLIWIVGASIALGRSEATSARRPAVAAATH